MNTGKKSQIILQRGYETNFKKSFISNLSKVMSMVLIISMVLSMLAVPTAASGTASSAEPLEENDSSVSTFLIDNSFKNYSSDQLYALFGISR